MRLYRDDNITDRRVVAHLQRAGHAVVLPAAVVIPGSSYSIPTMIQRGT
jgi:hypothetical protein